MRAMVLERVGAPLRLVERPTPAPGPHQVLLGVAACGVCRTDLHVVDGELPRPALPLIPGHEIVGHVVALGEGVEGPAVGARVGVPWLGSTCGTCLACLRGQENLCPSARFTGYQLDSGYAEYAVADYRYCFPLPELPGDVDAAPLLCAGLIGYRSYRLAGDPDAQGRPTRMVCTELDVTARKRVTEALRLSEAKFSGIVAISADAIVSIDENQRITLFNEGAEKIFGYSRSEVLGAPLDALLPERFRAAHRRHVERFAGGEDGARRMEARESAILGLRKDGEEFPAEACISRLDVDGAPILTVALRDCSEQRRRESEIELLADVGAVLASSLDYQDTLTSIAGLAVRSFADACAIDVVDERGELQRMKIVSRDPANAWAWEVLTRVPLDPRRPHLTLSAMETGQTILMSPLPPEVIVPLSRSEEHLRALRAADPRSLIAVPLRTHDGLLGVIVFASSTPSRVYGPLDVRLAEELALRAALSIENALLYRATQRAVQARDDVLGIVAHDLRNPLAAILMQAATLRRAPERGLQSAEVIARAADRMNRLIRDLLDVTCVEAGRLAVERTRVSVAPLLADSVAAQRGLASSASLELRLDAATDLPEVWADRDRILQVLENLIGNAVKFTGAGGVITVGAAPPRDSEVVFWVEDTGAGIPAEDVPHLFDRFWQARRPERRGAGLGLPIVKGIVEAHGGRIWVESTPGRGSAFFFTIPVTPAAEPSPPAARQRRT